MKEKNKKNYSLFYEKRLLFLDVPNQKTTLRKKTPTPTPTSISESIKNKHPKNPDLDALLAEQISKAAEEAEKTFAIIKQTLSYLEIDIDSDLYLQTYIENEYTENKLLNNFNKELLSIYNICKKSKQSKKHLKSKENFLITNLGILVNPLEPEEKSHIGPEMSLLKFRIEDIHNIEKFSKVLTKCKIKNLNNASIKLIIDTLAGNGISQDKAENIIKKITRKKRKTIDASKSQKETTIYVITTILQYQNDKIKPSLNHLIETTLHSELAAAKKEHEEALKKYISFQTEKKELIEKELKEKKDINKISGETFSKIAKIELEIQRSYIETIEADNKSTLASGKYEMAYLYLNKSKNPNTKKVEEILNCKTFPKLTTYTTLVDNCYNKGANIPSVLSYLQTQRAIIRSSKQKIKIIKNLCKNRNSKDGMKNIISYFKYDYFAIADSNNDGKIERSEKDLIFTNLSSKLTDDIGLINSLKENLKWNKNEIENIINGWSKIDEQEKENAKLKISQYIYLATETINTINRIKNTNLEIQSLINNNDSFKKYNVYMGTDLDTKSSKVYYWCKPIKPEEEKIIDIPSYYNKSKRIATVDHLKSIPIGRYISGLDLDTTSKELKDTIDKITINCYDENSQIDFGLETGLFSRFGESEIETEEEEKDKKDELSKAQHRVIQVETINTSLRIQNTLNVYVQNLDTFKTNQHRFKKMLDKYQAEPKIVKTAEFNNKIYNDGVIMSFDYGIYNHEKLIESLNSMLPIVSIEEEALKLKIDSIEANTPFEKKRLKELTALYKNIKGLRKEIEKITNTKKKVLKKIKKEKQNYDDKKIYQIAAGSAQLIFAIGTGMIGGKIAGLVTQKALSKVAIGKGVEKFAINTMAITGSSAGMTFGSRLASMTTNEIGWTNHEIDWSGKKLSDDFFYNFLWSAGAVLSAKAIMGSLNRGQNLKWNTYKGSSKFQNLKGGLQNFVKRNSANTLQAISSIRYVANPSLLVNIPPGHLIRNLLPEFVKKGIGELGDELAEGAAGSIHPALETIVMILNSCDGINTELVSKTKNDTKLTIEDGEIKYTSKNAKEFKANFEEILGDLSKASTITINSDQSVSIKLNQSREHLTKQSKELLSLYSRKFDSGSNQSSSTITIKPSLRTDLKPEVSIQRAIDNAGGLKPENLAEIEKTLKKQGFLCTHNKIQGFKYLTFKKGDFETSFKANKSTVEIIKTEEIETIKKEVRESIENILGAGILHKSDSKLHTTKGVQKTQEIKKKRGEKVSQKPAEKINNWLKALEEIYKVKRDNPEEVQKIKKRFYEAHVIKAESIPQSYFILQQKIARNQGHGNVEITEEFKRNHAENIIADQKSTLDTWIDYFLSSDSDSYPMWAKYWAFNGMLKLGKFDKEKKSFKKRRKNTVTPFVDLNPEALAYVMDIMIKKVKKEKIEGLEDNPELKNLLDSAGFSKLYAFELGQLNASEGKEMKNTKGKWVKYERGGDHMPLVESLKGKGTGWCTAGESTAENQLEDGDFYVYYSYDSKGKATIPRLAIRMKENKIAEVRGVDYGQNIDSYIAKTPILEKKIEEFGAEGKKYEKRATDMKMLTKIDKKTNDGQELTREELIFIYEFEVKIEGFGYGADPRLKEIRDKRDFQEDIKIIKPFKFPKHYKGTLDLSMFTSLEDIELPKTMIGGSLNLCKLTTANGIKFPKGLFELNLNSIETTRGLHLPEGFNGTLQLASLKINITNIEDSLDKIPKKGNIYCPAITALYVDIMNNANSNVRSQFKKGATIFKSLPIGYIKDTIFPKRKKIMFTITKIEGKKITVKTTDQDYKKHIRHSERHLPRTYKNTIHRLKRFFKKGTFYHEIYEQSLDKQYHEDYHNTLRLLTYFTKHTTYDKLQALTENNVSEKIAIIKVNALRIKEKNNPDLHKKQLEILTEAGFTAKESKFLITILNS